MVTVGLVVELANDPVDGRDASGGIVKGLRDGAGVPEEILVPYRDATVLVNAVHELSPADDLADETFERVERYVLFCESCINDFLRGEQADVEDGSDDGVIDESVLSRDRIFVNAEIREALGDEIFKPRPRVRSGDGVAEIFGAAGIVREMFLHPGDGFLDIRMARRGRWHGRRMIFRELFPVVFIERPLPAFRITIGIHEYPHPFPLRLIERRHERLFTTGDVLF